MGVKNVLVLEKPSENPAGEGDCMALLREKSLICCLFSVCDRDQNF